ncbi:MAG: hypothetical protein K0Q72_1123 [Armatimonadetes bacterium]|jgi:hypothetical protein|nr:hypothetical protein [Armatimonadota bacterium]
MLNDWPFDGPPRTAAITVRAITEGVKPILIVVHYADDGTWGFFTGEEFREDEALFVGLGAIYAVDRSIAELVDLPPGWWAWRDAPGAPWQRAPDEDQSA